MESMMKRIDGFTRIAAPAGADFVQAVTLGVIANRQRKWQRVFHHTE
jgi:hypothetical protein